MRHLLRITLSLLFTYNLCAISAQVSCPSPPGLAGAFACSVCDFNTIDASTGGQLPSNPGGDWCGGVIDNDQYFGFVAGTTGAVEFEVSVSSCASGSGIQLAIFDADGGVVGTCVSTSVNPGQTQTLVAGGLTPGEYYLLGIDGFAGAICDFTITPVSGLLDSGPTNVGPIDGPMNACWETINSYSIDPVPGATGYFWTVTLGAFTFGATVTPPEAFNPITGAVDPTITIELPEVPSFMPANTCDIITMEVFPLNPCFPPDPNVSSTFDLEVCRNSIDTIRETVCFGESFEYPPGSGNFYGPSEYFLFNTISLGFGPPDGCEQFEVLILTPIPPVVDPDVRPVVLCQDDDFTLCAGADPAAPTGALACNIPSTVTPLPGDPPACDTQAIYFITRLNPEAFIEGLYGSITCNNLEDTLYAVTRQPGSTIPQSSQGDSITYTWTNAGGSVLGNDERLIVDMPGTYTLEVTMGTTVDPSFFCSEVADFVVADGRLDPVEPTVAGDLTPCANDLPQTYTASGALAGDMYTWTVTPASVVFTTNGDMITVSDAAGNTSFDVCAVSMNGCDVSPQRCETVTLREVPVQTSISGPAELCEGESGTYPLTDYNAGWTYTATTTIPGATVTESGGSISLTMGTAAGDICVVVSNDCGSQPQVCFPVDLSPEPISITPTGPTPVCLNDTEDYTLYGTLPAGSTVTPTVTGGTITNQAGGTISVNWDTPGAGTICATTTNRCGTTAPACFTVTVVDPGTATLSGGGDYCEGDNQLEIRIDFTGNGPYSYTYELDGSPVSGTSATTPVVLTAPAPGTYVLTDFTADGCLGTGTGTAVVVEDPTPTAALSGSGVICTGDQGQLSIDFTGDPNWTYEIALDNVGQGPQTATWTPITINVSDAGTYTLLSVVSSAGCPGTVSGTAVLDVIPELMVSAPVYTCAPDAETYTATYTLSGGDGTSYQVIPASAGTITGNTFVSNSIAHDAVYSFEFTDATACDTVLATGTHQCDCITRVGSLSAQQLDVCVPGNDADASASYDATPEILDPNDIRSYFLHTAAGTTITGQLAANGTGIFSFDPGTMVYGTVYYISVAVGNDDGSGIVDLADRCTQVAAGVPVVFTEAPTAALVGGGSICTGQDTTALVNFTGAAPYTLTFEVAGASQTITTSDNPYTIDLIGLTAATNVRLVSVTSNGCPGTVNGDINIGVNEEISTVTTTQCNSTATAYRVTIVISGGDAGSYSVTPATGTITGNTFVSDEIPQGTGYSFSVQDQFGCNVELSAAPIVPCDCISDAGTADPATPITICGTDPVTVVNPLDTAMDANDVFNFIMHDGAGNAIGSTIFFQQTSPTFVFDQSVLSYGTTYYISPVMGNDDGSGLVDLTDICLDVAVGTPVQWLEVPVVSIGADQDLCVGDPINLTFNVVSSASVTVEYTNGTQTWTELIAPGTQVISAPLTSDETYTIVSASAGGACPGVISGSAAITVHDAPVGGAVTITYNSTVTQYQVSFDISGGDPSSYTVNGVAAGGTSYTSAFIDCGNDYEFIIDDQWACDPDTLASPVNCDCITRVGSIGSDFASCDETEPVNIAYDATNEVLDGNDAVEYILHAGDFMTPIQRSSTPNFSFDPTTMTLGTTYIIVAVAGDANAGVVVLDDDCTVVSNEITAIWSDPPVAFISGGGTVCPGIQTDLNIDVTGPGMISVVYTDGITLDTIVVMQGRETFPAPSLDSADYTLVEVYSAACPGTVSGTANVRVLEGIVVSPARVTRNASNTEYTVSFTISGGDPATYTVDNTPLNGQTVFTSPSIPCGTPYSFAFDDAGGCSPVVISDNPDCNCLTVVGSIANDFQSCDDTDLATVAYDATNENLVQGDIVEFFLYATDPTAPIIRNGTGSFAFDPSLLTKDVVYTIVAVAGFSPDGINIDLGNPCVSYSTTTTAVWYTSPDATVTGPTAICFGEDWAVTFEVTGSGIPKTITYTLAGATETVTGLVPGTPRTVNLPVTGDATLVLVSVEDQNCTTALTQSIAVSVGSEITVTDPVRTCNAAETDFTVTFDINGGDASTYSVSPMGTLTVTGPSSATFVSNELPNGATYSFIITDASGCFAPEVNGVFACNCVTDAGTMIDTDVQEICLGDPIDATHDTPTYLFDGNDILLFALRTDNDRIDYRDDVLEISATPVFSSVTLNDDQTYYVTPIAGNPTGGGTDIELNDPCQSIGISTPFYIRPDPTGSLTGDTLLCETQSAEITIVLQGVGPFDVVIGQSGDGGPDTTLTAISSPTVYVVDPNNPGTYILRSVRESSDPQCSSDPNSEVTIDVEELVNAGIADEPLNLCAGTGALVTLNDRLTDEDTNGSWAQIDGADAGADFDSALGRLVNQSLNPGLYTFQYTVGDGFPCPTDDAAVQVSIEPTPIADAGVDQQLTCDSPVATLGGSNIDPTFTYAWTGGEVDNSTAPNTSTAEAGTYQLTVVAPGEIGCFDTDIVLVEASGELPTFESLVGEGVTCFGDTDGTVTAQVTGGSAPYEYTLSGVGTSNRSRFTELEPGQYDLQVIDAEGCEYVERVIVEAAKEVVVDAGPDAEIEFGQGHEVNLYLEGDVEEVRWSGDSILCISTGEFCDNAILTPQFSGTYQVEVIDSNGCTASDFIQLLVNKERPVFIPSAFSPNGDGSNELVFVRAAEGAVEAVTNFRIFNRWGEVVFSRGEHTPNNPNFGWNGRQNGEVLNPAVFAYWCEVRYPDGTTEIFRGDITLVDN